MSICIDHYKGVLSLDNVSHCNDEYVCVQYFIPISSG